jgi:hypothetical protein
MSCQIGLLRGGVAHQNASKFEVLIEGTKAGAGSFLTVNVGMIDPWVAIKAFLVKDMAPDA